jgi:ABC-type multidrug transport system fused ATPase/permease subunit
MWQLLYLTGATVLLGAIQAVLIWFSYRQVIERAGQALDGLHVRMLQRTLSRASDEGVAAQRWKAEQLLEKSLPQVRSGLISWWRAIPRSIVTLVGCLGVAMLIDPALTLLAAISGLLLWRLATYMTDDDDESSGDWELPDARRRLLELLQQAPLLARIQSRHGVDHLYSEQLRLLKSKQQRVDLHWSRLVPIVGFGLGLALALLALVMGGRILDQQHSLNLAGAMVLLLFVIAAAAAGFRILAMIRELGPARKAANNLYDFLDAHPSPPSSMLVGFANLRQSVQLERVSLLDGLGHPLLEDLSLELKPGQIIALMGKEPVGVQAVVELLMGYGRPHEGRLTFDGINVAEIHPNSLSKQVMWVAADGPLWPGTIIENISADQEISLDEIVDVTKQLGIYDDLQNLPDGFNTVVTTGDARLSATLEFGIGLSRALVRCPAVAILEEPPRDPQGTADELPTRGLRQLALSGSLVIVLPRRLSSLRAADRVLLLHQGKLAVEGTHQALLESNDLYRHLNYLLFNPYRK